MRAGGLAAVLTLPLPAERAASSRLALVCAACFFAVGAVFRAVFGAEFGAVLAGLGVGLGLGPGLGLGLGRDLEACALLGARGDAAGPPPIMLFQALPS